MPAVELSGRVHNNVLCIYNITCHVVCVCVILHVTYVARHITKLHVTSCVRVCARACVCVCVCVCTYITAPSSSGFINSGVKIVLSTVKSAPCALTILASARRSQTCVCVCVRERERVCVCMCVYVTDVTDLCMHVCVCVCVRERISRPMCVCEREDITTYVCVCV
jgi:hypothetical protein